MSDRLTTKEIAQKQAEADELYVAIEQIKEKDLSYKKKQEAMVIVRRCLQNDNMSVNEAVSEAINRT